VCEHAHHCTVVVGGGRWSKSEGAQQKLEGVVGMASLHSIVYAIIIFSSFHCVSANVIVYFNSAIACWK